ncbi:MAG: polyprenyl synthetase family protein [Saprospiraceae bacterium]|nr:polyprenyl synthetase family protein [Saprospiraceae bacterium]MBK9223045.1 polyprenyl synthetase family protein [Saprospiraceae bacterium]MBK9720575.1 polyprenyl synthetase family protein [Saprospiraceae bacterium]
MHAAITLDEIKKPVNQALVEFDRHFKQAMSSKVPLLDRITYYLVKTKGKQFRPLIALLSAKLFGEIHEKSYAAATLVELLHTATLVHDDVVDESYQRRGFFSIKALWKNKIAVLVGDYLLSRGLLTALQKKHFDLLEILSTAVSEMSEGELLQLEKARRLDITEAIYFQIIKQKTASLIRSACVCGAKSNTEDESHLNNMFHFGEKIGIAFQIKDDLMDLSNDFTGKPKIADIKEKKMTLPLIAALSAAPMPKKNRIISLIRNQNENQNSIQEVIQFIHDYKGIETAQFKMDQYRDEALEILKHLPQNEANVALTKLCYFVTERKK